MLGRADCWRSDQKVQTWKSVKNWINGTVIFFGSSDRILDQPGSLKKHIVVFGRCRILRLVNNSEGGVPIDTLHLRHGKMKIKIFTCRPKVLSNIFIKSLCLKKTISTARHPI